MILYTCICKLTVSVSSTSDSGPAEIQEDNTYAGNSSSLIFLNLIAFVFHVGHEKYKYMFSIVRHVDLISQRFGLPMCWGLYFLNLDLVFTLNCTWHPPTVSYIIDVINLC